MYAFASDSAPLSALDAGLRDEICAHLRHVAGQAGRLGLAPAAQWDLHTRVNSARAQLSAATPSILLLRIALLSLRSLLRQASAEDDARVLTGRLDNCLRRLPA
jgi:hypothetical protein